MIIIGRHWMRSSRGYFNEKTLLDLFPSAAIPADCGSCVVGSAGSTSTVTRNGKIYEIFDEHKWGDDDSLLTLVVL